jgi:hypothetical protein
VWAGVGNGSAAGRDWDDSRGSGCELNSCCSVVIVSLTARPLGWWNYFQHGLDFLVDDEGSGEVMKIMVHSNIVSGTTFSKLRCRAKANSRCARY